jgi:methyltransferase (TIGR00027 family)
MYSTIGSREKVGWSYQDLIAVQFFLIIEIVLLPFTILGTLLLHLHFSLAFVILRARGKRVSMTAYEPAFTRWMLHVQGKRVNQAVGPLLFSLPGVSPITIWLMMGPTILAMYLTGRAVPLYDYPLYSSSNLISAIAHRTRFFDDTLKSYLEKIEQVVILGAGWDTRAYDLSQKQGVRVFEVDAPDTQVHKRIALISCTKVNSSRVVFATANFNRQSWLDALLSVGFDPAKATFVLWEGVTYYLHHEAVEATLQIVAKQLAPGSAIAFDYWAKHLIEGDDSSILNRFLCKAVQIMGEPWVFGISTVKPAREQLKNFLEQYGLKLSRYEPIGKVDKRQRVEGGLALAVNC